jgi:hypothetical protein
MNEVIKEGTFIIADNFYRGCMGDLYTKGKKIFGKLWKSDNGEYFCRAKLISNCEHDVSVIYEGIK